MKALGRWWDLGVTARDDGDAIDSVPSGDEAGTGRWRFKGGGRESWRRFETRAVASLLGTWEPLGSCSRGMGLPSAGAVTAKTLLLSGGGGGGTRAARFRSSRTPLSNLTRSPILVMPISLRLDMSRSSKTLPSMSLRWNSGVYWSQRYRLRKSAISESPQDLTWPTKVMPLGGRKSGGVDGRRLGASEAGETAMSPRLDKGASTVPSYFEENPAEVGVVLEDSSESATDMMAMRHATGGRDCQTRVVARRGLNRADVNQSHGRKWD